MGRAQGCFITLEGIDGAGKSTHLPWLAERIRSSGHAVVTTREPGGTVVGEALRDLLLHAPMTHDCEALLMFAARREHLHNVIRPALARGDWVLCDRFTDATFAYQGGGHGVPTTHLAALETWIQGDTRPDRTFLFDLPSDVSRQRLGRARGAGAPPDKFERESGAFFDAVRSAYLERARAEPGRFRIIDSSKPMAEVRDQLSRHIAVLEAEIGSA